jgi:hypothetical protein
MPSPITDYDDHILSHSGLDRILHGLMDANLATCPGIPATSSPYLEALNNDGIREKPRACRDKHQPQKLPEHTMSKKPESPMERLKKVTLWQWGLIVIFAGVVSNQLMGLQATRGSAAARGQAFGRGAATLLFVIAGVVLIIMHFVRRKRH